MPRHTAGHCDEERLRKEEGSGAIVLVGIVDIVRVELELVVVDVQDRRLHELAIRIRIIASAHPINRTLGVEVSRSPELISSPP